MFKFGVCARRSSLTCEVGRAAACRGGALRILDGGQGGASQCLQRPSAIWLMRSSGFYHKQQVHMGSDRWTMTLKGTLQPT